MAYFKGIDQRDTIYFYLASKHYIKILKFFGIWKIAEVDVNRNWIENLAIKIFCNNPLDPCSFFLRHFTDKDSVLIDKDQIPFFLKYAPARCSTKGLEHFSQLMEHKDNAKFTKFDYGAEENQKRYG